MPMNLTYALIALLASTAASASPFGNTFGGRTALAEGVTSVTGSFIERCESDDPAICARLDLDTDDFFSFNHLAPGSPYSLTVTNRGSDPMGLYFWVLDAEENEMHFVRTSPFEVDDDPVSETFTGSVPDGGELVVHAMLGEDWGGYRVELTQATWAPEPASVVLLGFGLVLIRRGKA